MATHQNINRALNNDMTRLVKKIQRRLGMEVMTLPTELQIDNWHTIIEEDTIPTFSRYFPYGMTIIVDHTCFKDGWYYIDNYLPAGTKILGVKDLAFDMYRNDPRFDRYGINFSTYDFISRDYAIDDVALQQVGADFRSLFNLGIYIETEPPNKVRLVSVNGSQVSKFRNYPLKIYVEHTKDLHTISLTMMETFEKLAQSDIALWLFQHLKYYDNFETTFSNLDLKLATLEEWANKRDDIVKELQEAYVSAANEYENLILTV